MVVEFWVFSASVGVALAHVVGSDLEEKSGVGQQEDLVDDELPRSPLHVEHHESEISNEKDDFEGKSSHGDDLVPSSVIDHHEETYKAESADGLHEEYVVEQKVHLETLHEVTTELEGDKEAH